MGETNNYFVSDYLAGDFTIATNVISGANSGYKVGQYIRILDSFFNDGVYKIKTIVSAGTYELEGTLTDEEYSGFVCGLKVPPDFVSLSEEIDAYNAKSGDGVSSESIPNYSVSYSGKKYQEQFADEISRYRKAYLGIYYFIND